MSALLVARLFRTAGGVAPEGVVTRTLSRAPRGRLVRAVAWFVYAASSGASSESLLRGVRLVVRGWDDVYATTSLPRDVPIADIERPTPKAALVIRSARIGRGWQKEPLPSIGAVRPELDLAVAWLARSVGCIVHEDCAQIPELGAACFAMQE